MLGTEALLLLVTSLCSTHSAKYLSIFVAVRTRVTEEGNGRCWGGMASAFSLGLWD